MRATGILCGLLLLLVQACAASPPTDGAKAFVAAGVVLARPSPASLGRSVEAVQLITARRGGETQTFEARLSVSAEALLLVANDAFGQRLLTLRWDGRNLVETDRAGWLPERITGDNILADVFLVHWPREALQAGLQGAELRETDGTRSVFRDGREVIRITRSGDGWSGESRLENRDWHYELLIRSAEIAP